MKLLPQIKTTDRRDSVNGRTRAEFPIIDCHYQAGGFGEFSSGGKGKPSRSIRGISEEYFDNEARGHFVTEAAFFALIFVTSVVPVIEGLRGLVQFVNGVL